jgi:hypothetical protein
MYCRLIMTVSISDLMHAYTLARTIGDSVATVATVAAAAVGSSDGGNQSRPSVAPHWHASSSGDTQVWCKLFCTRYSIVNIHSPLGARSNAPILQRTIS